MTSKLFKASIALIVISVVLLVILQAFYFPSVVAFKNDLLNSIGNLPNNTHTELPVPEDYGLNYNTLLLIVTLGNIAYVLLFIGAAFLVIILIAHLAKRTRGYDAAKHIDETPKTS